MTTPTPQELLANDLLIRHPEINLSSNPIDENFKVTFAGMMFDCRCELRKGDTQKYYRFAIECEDVYDYDDNHYVLFGYTYLVVDNDEDYYKTLMNMLEWNKDILNNLVYDNRHGKLIDPRVIRPLTKIQEIEDIRSNYMGDMIVNNTEECCVCYEKTNSKTSCGHSICYRCVKKVKKKEGDRDCPMCRKTIYMS